MQSPFAEKAVLEAQQYGRAILKFISANDCGLTGSNQAGFYLPKAAWNLYAPFPPIQGRNDKSKVRIMWQGEYPTDSVVTWYGKGKKEKPRSEYRLTSFGRKFPYLNEDMVGDMMVLIPKDHRNFLAYIIDLPEDIDDVQAALGVEAIGTWAIYDSQREPPELSEDDCIDQQFRKFAESVRKFPAGRVFSEKAKEALIRCITDFDGRAADDRLMELMRAEYRLFQMVERQLCTKQVCRLFKDIDDFLKTASAIMNRRKSRAGRSMENHVAYLLRDAGIPFDVRPSLPGEPDILIPGRTQYEDLRFPAQKLFMVGVKTTCKDRWWKVTQEAPRVAHKHLLTIQEGVSASQMTQMHEHGVSLVVPKKLHSRYPRVRGVHLLDVEGFIRTVKRKLA